jgi:type IV fimbrial biogenesis protein FimT
MNHCRERGLTLIELMITLSIIAILVSLAGPPYRQFIQNNRLSGFASEMQRALWLARAEAMTRARRVTVCRSTDGSACSTAAGTWTQGWMVFVDADSDGVRDADEQILLVQQPLLGISSANGSTNLASYVSYTGTGYAALLNGSPQSGSIVFCDNRGESAARPVIITATGTPSVGAAPTSCTP